MVTLPQLQSLRPETLRLLLALAFTCLIGVVSPWQEVFHPDDEGFELMKSWLLERGFPLYSEIWSDQPPLHTLLLAAVFHVFGPSVAIARMVALGFAWLAFWALGELAACRQGTPAACLAMTALALAAGFTRIAASATIMLPAYALALVSIVLLRPRSRRREEAEHSSIAAVRLLTSAATGVIAGHWRLLLSGACFGLAMQIKFTPVLLLPVVAWELLRRNASDTAGERPANVRVRFRGLAIWAGGAALAFGSVLALFPAMTTELLWSPHFSPETRTAFASAPGPRALHAMLLADWDLVLLTAGGLMLAGCRKRAKSIPNSAVGGAHPPAGVAGCALASSSGEHAHVVKTPYDFVPRGFSPRARKTAPEGGCAPHAASEFIPPLLLLVTAYGAHLWQRPFWGYYYLHLAVPLAWLAALTVCELARWVAEQRSRRTLLAGFALAVAVLIPWVVRLPERMERARNDLRTYHSDARSVLVEILRKHSGQWCFSSHPGIAFQAGVPVPPEAVVLSQKRLRLGLFANRDFIHCLETRKPGIVAFGGANSFGQPGASYLREHYEPLGEVAGFILHRRRPL